MLLKSYNKNIDVFSFNEKDGRVERKVENFNDEDVVGSFFETVDGKKSLFYREIRQKLDGLNSLYII